jgi:hypothetical protein
MFSMSLDVARDGALDVRDVQMPRSAPPDSATCVAGILENTHLEAGSEGVVRLRMRYMPPR